MVLPDMKNHHFSGTFYHIFVPSFCDSNGDGIGDIPGITGKLDYLEELGVEGLWLSPIHPSASYHKYDIDDFYGIAPEYGTLEDYKTLLDECHKRGMKVLLDLIQNCPSNRHPAFIKALNDPSCKEASWFWFRDSEETENFPDDLIWLGLPSWQTAANGKKYIGIYADVMPDFNLNSPGLRKELKHIARFWLKLGVDGFRLDSAQHLYSTSEVAPGVSHHALNIEWFEEFGRYCRSVNPDCFLVGEVWTDSSTRSLYYKSLDSTFHFDLGADIRDLINGSVSKSLFTERLISAHRCASLVNKAYTDAPFLSNHDMLRYADDTLFDEAHLKLSAAIYLTLPGRPFVYYGEELGLRGQKDDWCTHFPKKDLYIRSRTAFPWNTAEEPTSIHFRKPYASRSLEEQEKDPSSLLWFYRYLIRLRKTDTVLRNGSLDFGGNNLPDSLLGYYRRDAGKKVLVLHNISEETVIADLPQASSYIDLMCPQEAALSLVNNSLSVLPFHSIVVYF